ncbi:MAG: hypothetical protein GX316_11520, partial [Firmicutes bacterium]|nr:hypothetical protein [Bacillota bacterium]
MQYRLDFFAGLAGVFILNGMNIASLGVLTYRFQTLGGWDIGELLLLYSLFMICRSIYSTFLQHVEALEEEIAQGTLDRFLTRPISPLLQLIGQDVQYIGIADFLFGLACFYTSVSLIHPAWGFIDIVWLVIFLVSGVIIETSISLICASIAFKAVRVNILRDIIMRTKVITQQYPIAVFGNAFRVLVTGFIPIAFINYYPALFLLRKKTDAPLWLSGL